MADDKAPKLDVMVDKLAAMGVLTVDGKKLDAAALKKQLQGKVVAVSFGFQGCQGLCPPINEKHRAMAENAKNPDDFVTLVINVLPDQSKTQEQRDAYVNEVKAEGKNHTVIGIYTTEKEQAKTLQRDMKLFTVGNERLHSPMITLYDKSGEYVGRKNGKTDTVEVFKAWSKPFIDAPAPASKTTGMIAPTLDGKALAAMQDFAGKIIPDAADSLPIPTKPSDGKSATRAA